MPKIALLIGFVTFANRNIQPGLLFDIDAMNAILIYAKNAYQKLVRFLVLICIFIFYMIVQVEIQIGIVIIVNPYIKHTK